MYSLETIVAMNNKACKNAKENFYEPLVAEFNGDSGVFKCPDLGNYEPQGWELIDTFFVDNSGFGIENELALTAKQFLGKVKKGFGYAVIETGQFQIHVGEFKRA